jgi:hypothetical protein
MIKSFVLKRFFIVSGFICLAAIAAFAQSTAFNYQGKLIDTGAAQSTYQMQFALFDALTGGTQLGGIIANPAVTVNQGVFSVTLDFGASVFTGADRFLQISVRRNTSEAYTVLSPREKIASSPYSVRTLSAAQADVALDANKLGGLDANQYVTTATVGSSFIKNSTTPQTANFNISGNGIVSGNLGVGVLNPQAKLDVSGDTLIRSTGSGGNLQLGTPNGETGITMLNTNRADIRFDNSTLRLLVGSGTTPALNTNGITINTLGNVGIGFTNPTSRLYVLSPVAGTSAVYGESSTGRGLWGKSVSSRGVFGESSTLEGVFGVSTSGTGVSGNSTSGIGVYGETNAASLTTAGVYGKGTGSGSIGVIGEANVNNAVGVFGVSTSPTGFGIYARNNSGGRAIFAEGNVAQNLNSNGLVKAMLAVNADGTIARCYNGVTNSSSGNCGFTISTSSLIPGRYNIAFGFQVDNRFVSVTAEQTTLNGGGVNIGTGYNSSGQNIIVRTFITDIDFDSSQTNNPFMIIVY